jgi:type I restriction enzyme S subunit
MTGVSPAQWEIVRTILRRHVPGREVKFYGSRARNRFKPFSDLDLAILGEQPVPWDVLIALKNDYVESELPFKVDITPWSSFSQAMRDAIAADLRSLPE